MRLAREHIETAKRAFDELGIGKTRDIKPPQDDVPPYTDIPDWVNDGTGDDHVDLEHHAEAAATSAQSTSTGNTEKPKSKDFSDLCDALRLERAGHDRAPRLALWLSAYPQIRLGDGFAGWRWQIIPDRSRNAGDGVRQ